MLPWVSAKTWISIWRGRGEVALDQHAVVAEGGGGLALGAFQRAAAEVSRQSATTRMPLPPPPALALIRTGKPMRAASAASSAGSWSAPW